MTTANFSFDTVLNWASRKTHDVLVKALLRNVKTIRALSDKIDSLESELAEYKAANNAYEIAYAELQNLTGETQMWKDYAYEQRESAKAWRTSYRALKATLESLVPPTQATMNLDSLPAVTPHVGRELLKGTAKVAESIAFQSVADMTEAEYLAYRASLKTPTVESTPVVGVGSFSPEISDDDKVILDAVVSGTDNKPLSDSELVKACEKISAWRKGGAKHDYAKGLISMRTKGKLS